MTIDVAFQIYLSRLIPPDGVLEKARKRRDFIKGILENTSGLCPIKFFDSGSYAKKTYINPLKDIDVAAYYDLNECKKNNGEFYEPGTILGKFYNRLQQTYSEKNINVRRQKRSVGIRSDDFDVEIVPVYWDGNEEYIGLLPDRESKKWIKTSIPLHVQLIKNRDKSYRPYGKTVRLFKAWKAYNHLPLKGFALELIVIKALDTNKTSSHFGENFYRVLEYVISDRFNNMIWFNDYLRLKDIKVKLSPIMIMDPVNRLNNITSEITMDEKEKILNKFDHAYNQARWALDAEYAGDEPKARERWRAIFGKDFPTN